LWLADLTAVEEPAPHPVADGDGGEDDDQPAAEAGGDAAGPAPAAPQRLGNPTVTSSGSGRYTTDGAFKWVAGFDVAAAHDSDSWIIQKVVLNDEETFYEAFSVAAGATSAADQDTYQDSSRDWEDQYKVVGDARHYVFGNGASPPGFTYGAGSADAEQLAAVGAPAWWSGDAGTAHNLTFNLHPPTITTVPDSGDAVEVESLAGLDAADSDGDEDPSSESGGNVGGASAAPIASPAPIPAKDS
jgi:hypothetical protein